MYCSQEDLSSISKELVGKKLEGLYQDWYNGIIYMLFYDPVHGNKIAAIKNNYYAGISILREAQEGLIDVGKSKAHGMRNLRNEISSK